MLIFFFEETAVWVCRGLGWSLGSLGGAVELEVVARVSLVTGDMATVLVTQVTGHSKRVTGVSRSTEILEVTKEVLGATRGLKGVMAVSGGTEDMGGFPEIWSAWQPRSKQLSQGGVVRRREH